MNTNNINSTDMDSEDIDFTPTDLDAIGIDDNHDELLEETKEAESHSKDISSNLLAYSDDIFSIKYEEESLLAHIVSSILLSPIRITIRVLFYYMVLPANMKHSLWCSTCFVSIVCALTLGLGSIILRNNILLLLVSIIMSCISFYNIKLCSKAIPAIKEKKKIKINKRRVVKLCETIYDKLDNLNM